MKPDIWMPTFIGEYMQETLHLNRADHGSYQLLRMAYWSNGGPLPEDDESLRTICKCTPEEWPRTKGLLSKLFIVSEGQWRHERLDQEIRKARSLSRLRKRVGRDGAAKRWQTDSNGHGKGDGRSIANACQLPSPLPLPLPVPENRQIEEAPPGRGQGVEGRGALGQEGEGRGAIKVVEVVPEIPPMTRQAYETMAEMRGIPKDCYDWFWNTCEGTGWLDFRGRPIRKVEPLLLNTFVKWRQNDFKGRRNNQPERPASDAEILRQAQG